jgi:hypothetical protein
MTNSESGAVTGSVRLWLRFEGLAVLALAAYLYARGGYSWVLFAVLFLAPDLSFAGYLAGPRVGAAVYNVVHSYVGPAALVVLSIVGGRSPAVALIWAAHIGFDRLLGYGLKYPTSFGDTHLGAIGRSRKP